MHALRHMSAIEVSRYAKQYMPSAIQRHVVLSASILNDRIAIADICVPRGMEVLLKSLRIQSNIHNAPERPQTIIKEPHIYANRGAYSSLSVLETEHWTRPVRLYAITMRVVIHDRHARHYGRRITYYLKAPL